MDNKAIKLSGNNSWDSSSVTHNRVPLNEILSKRNIIHYLKIQSNTSIGTSSDTLIPIPNGNFDGISIKNGNIEIGNGIKLIRVCAMISIQNSTSTGGQRRLNLKKNSETINVIYAYANNAIYYNATFTLNTVVEVSEGDVLSLTAASNSGNCLILTNEYSNLYIEVLK